MDKALLQRTVGTIVINYPQIIPHLTDNVFAVMTVDYFNATLSRMVSNVYTGNMGGEFVDILGALIRGQMRDAYNRAYAEARFSDALPDWLAADLETMQAEQANFDYIYGYYQAIVDARVDGRPLQRLLDRVGMWGNRWNEAYNRANMTITAKLGARLVWKYGDTEHCTTCLALNGIVAFASEWELSGASRRTRRTTAWNARAAGASVRSSRRTSGGVRTHGTGSWNMPNISIKVRGLEEVKKFIDDLPRLVRGIATEEIAKYLIGNGRRGLKRYPPYKYITRKAAYGKTFVSDKQRRYVMAKIREGRIDPGVPHRTGNYQRGWQMQNQGAKTKIV